MCMCIVRYNCAITWASHAGILSATHTMPQSEMVSWMKMAPCACSLVVRQSACCLYISSRPKDNHCNWLQQAWPID